MNYDLSPQAEADLEDIGDYVAQYSPVAAARLIDDFVRRWELLTLHPFSGPPRDDIAPGIRHLVIGDYLTLYRVTENSIEIIRVLHGKRDLGQIGLGADSDDAK